MKPMSKESGEQSKAMRSARQAETQYGERLIRVRGEAPTANGFSAF